MMKGTVKMKWLTSNLKTRKVKNKANEIAQLDLLLKFGTKKMKSKSKRTTSFEQHHPM